MPRRCCNSMPQKFETHLKGALVTCVGFLASSLGVFISILSVVVSPLFSLLSTPKPIFIGEGKAGPTPRLQHPSQKIRPRYIRQSSCDKSSSRSSNTISSSGTAHSVYSNRTTGNESPRSSSPHGTRFRGDTYSTSEPPIPSRPSTPRLMPMPPSPSHPQSPRDGLRTYLGMRKRSTLLDQPTPEEPSSVGNDELDPDERSPEQGFDRAEIIISPPTPSSSTFLHSAPGSSEVRFGDVNTPGKPAARFVKSHSKRHSLSAVCPRKRRSGKRPSNPPTPRSASLATMPVVGPEFQVAMRVSQRKKRKSLRIDTPHRSAASPVVIESGDDVGGQIIHEEPVSIVRPPISQLPLAPTRQGPVRTRPYEAPYFFPTPGSPEAIGYVERVREERRSVLVHPDAMLVRNKKDMKRSSTISVLEKDGTVGTPKGSGDRNTAPSPSSPADEFGVQVGTPTKLRKMSSPPQFSPFLDTSPTPTIPSRPQARRQGSRGILRILGKH